MKSHSSPPPSLQGKKLFMLKSVYVQHCLTQRDVPDSKYPLLAGSVNHVGLHYTT